MKDEELVYNDIMDVVYDEIDYELRECRSCLSSDNAEIITGYLFSSLSSSSMDQDNRFHFGRNNDQCVIRRDNAFGDDLDFTLRLRIDEDERVKSRRPHVERSNVHERQTKGIVDFIKKISTSMDNMDSERNPLEAYIDTFVAIEDGIHHAMGVLKKENKMDDDLYLSILNSGNVFFKYGGYHIIISAVPDTYSLVYEVTSAVSLMVKDDFAW